MNQSHAGWMDQILSWQSIAGQYQSNNQRQVELFTYGWNQPHAGWNDYIEDQSIKYRLNQSNAGWMDQILSWQSNAGQYQLKTSWIV